MRCCFYFIFILPLVLVLQSFEVNAYSQSPFIIAIGGGSASGKTYYARQIVEILGSHQVTLLSADNYYAPHKQPRDHYINGQINYDRPSAVDLTKLEMHLRYLKSGFPVSVEEYTFGRPVERPTLLSFQARPFIVVEGIYALYPQFRDLVDLRVFVDVPPEVRFARRLSRDRIERGLSEEEVRDYFERVVEPMHQTYIQPSALHADISVGSPNDPAAVRQILDMISSLSHQTRETKHNVLLNAYDQAIFRILQEQPNEYFIFSFEDMQPTQTSVGFTNIAEKGLQVDELVRQSATAFDLPSRLQHYLLDNAIPVIEFDQENFAIDHHHLMLALERRGISYFLVKKQALTSQIPDWAMEIVKNPKKRVTWDEVRQNNNTYRSLASLLVAAGAIRKTGRPHAEFEWASYLQRRFGQDHWQELQEIELQDPDNRLLRVQKAIQYAQSVEAQALPGYLGSCDFVLGPGR